MEKRTVKPFWPQFINTHKNKEYQQSGISDILHDQLTTLCSTEIEHVGKQAYLTAHTTPHHSGKTKKGKSC